MDAMEMTTRQSYETSLYSIETFSVQGTCENQQDAIGCLVSGSTAVMVVCDGIGGLEQGELAAETAVATVLKYAQRTEWKENPMRFLEEAIEKANEAVFRLTDRNGVSVQCGCTLVIVLAAGRRLFVANVGDSRVYLVKGEELYQLTRDHNYFEKLKRMRSCQEVTKEEYEAGLLKKAALTSYIGMGRLEERYISEQPLLLDRDEVIMLLSDGLYKLVSAKEIKDIVSSKVRCLDEAGELLLAKAAMNVENYQDNTSMILFRIK